MHNLYTKFVKILEICKQFSENLVNESGNVPRRGPVPRFSDLEVVALSLTAETESIDSEKWLFDYKLQEYKDCIPNLISRRQFNDRKKKTADCSIYGDKGYIGADVQLDLFETAHIRLECPYDSTKRIGNRHSFRLQRLEKGLRQYSHNLQTGSWSSETMRK